MTNIKHRKRLSHCIIFFTLLIAGGCSTSHFPWVYRIDVDQGNIVDEKKLEQVTIGMTPRQVKYLLGTPLINDSFHPRQWNYFYSYETGKGTITRTSVVLTFENEKLIKIDKKPFKTLKRKFY